MGDQQKLLFIEKNEREILFKAKRKDNGQWVYGQYVTRPVSLGGWNEPPSLEVNHYISSTNTLSKDLVEIDKSTLSQYINSEDKNGKKLFENDMIKDNRGNEFLIYYNLEWANFQCKSLGSATGTPLFNHGTLKHLTKICSVFDYELSVR